MDEQSERKSEPGWRSEEVTEERKSGQGGLRRLSTNRGRVHTGACRRSGTRCSSTRWRSGENGFALHPLAASIDVEVQDDMRRW
jgi:hypothetical protein